MPRVEIEEFSDKDISRIYIAGTIEEAERAEALLSENGISFAVQIEEFMGPGLLTSSLKHGWSFYVVSGQADFSRRLFLQNGLETGLIDDD